MTRLHPLLNASAAAIALCALPAQAALVFEGTYNSPSANAYIGNYVSTNFDSALFDNSSLGMGAFSNAWVFNITPNGSATVNANFIPGFPDPNSISGFQVGLYGAAAAGGCTANTFSTHGLCSGLSLGPLIVNGTNLGGSSSIPFTALSAGMYAFVISGTVVGLPVLYSGQLTTSPVPEPATLALVGLGLFAVGASLHTRQRKPCPAQAAAAR
jgi:hypothetical protein